MCDFGVKRGILQEKMCDSWDNGVFLKRTCMIFSLNQGFSKSKSVIFELNGGFSKRKCKILGLKGGFC